MSPLQRPRGSHSTRITPRTKRRNLQLELSRLLCQRLRSTVVLLDVEATQQHNRLVVVDAAVCLVGGVNRAVLVDLEDTAAATEPIIETAEIDGADAELAESGGAHHAGLYGDVEVGLVEDGGWVVEKDLLDRDELGVTGTLEGC